ncbi:hypothetical protein ACLB6G_20400 [Zhengella sp. ZM62]|uniref:hypothetical protein n=1 Tax=Zhengella sedimenti TaxID=3390035 RepID=UPI0039762603
MPSGGKRPGAGRPKGSRSAATKEQIANLSELAKMHSEAALDALVKIATKGESEAARVSAAVAILDRGYGKPSQAMTVGNPDGSAFGPSRIEIVAATDADRAD